jgi:hypothetical protein
MTTICITFTAPTLKDITRGISSDWGPTIHAAARRLGAVVGLVWALCSLASDRWQQLVAWAQEHQLHGLARLGLPGGNYPESPDSSAARVAPVLVVQRLAPALPPARPAANVAPPSIRHLAAQGCSQREIAGTLGLTRYQVRKALAA